MAYGRPVHLAQPVTMMEIVSKSKDSAFRDPGPNYLAGPSLSELDFVLFPPTYNLLAERIFF